MNKQKYAFITILCLTSLILSACITSGATAPKATETPAYTATPAHTATPEPTATKTPLPSPTPRPSPTHNLEATKQYEDMASKVKEYYQAGYVSTDQGTYKRLKPYWDSWAQIDWYQWVTVNSSPTNFIIRSEVSWESASKSPNPSGCGYVFRLRDENNHYMVFISTDGYIHASLVHSGYFDNMGKAYYGQAATKGKETVTLIVEGTSFRVLVNDKSIKSFEGLQSDLFDGNLAYTIVSGTNKDFGTHCMFDKTDLWTIKK